MEIPATSDAIPGTTALRDANGLVSVSQLKIAGMSSASRDALSGLTAGTMIYNSTTNKLNLYTGSAWEVMTSA